MKLDWRQVCLGFALGLVAAAGVQQLSWRRRSPERHIKRFAAELQLTSEQTEKMRSLFEEGRRKMVLLADERRGKIRELLTPEQLAKFDEIRERKKKKRYPR